MSALPHELLPDNATVDTNGSLCIAGCNVLALAQEFGTPLFVYDEDHIRIRCRQAREAFLGSVAYASKAFLCLAMAKLICEEGLDIDVATGGELHVALTAGVPAARIVMHGNNKSTSELAVAVNAGVGRIVVDSFDELNRLKALGRSTEHRPKVLLRITPGVEAHTHEYVTTGVDDTKFGFTVSSGLADAAIQRTNELDAVELVGLHAHIGSQVFELRSFQRAVEVVARFAEPYGLSELSLGGGLGVAYVEGESAPSIGEWADAIAVACAKVGFNTPVSVEPGRALVAAAAITLYEVGTIKELDGIRTYVAVDGGMSDNPRPVLYGSGYETFLPRALNSKRNKQVRVVGKHCESGDLLVREGRVPGDIAVGDILATPVTGAYGHSMGSNYNKVLRPAVVFVRQGDARVVVRRESYQDLLRNDL
ncbi:MAG: diaminopimelate decarboxylase [Acidimicrobiia bacterium]|nr:diaminopimelate decarboxylase [Acidimicrobiia bacterium]MYC58561.1 diaminopimelate decarboxylase [Acidimicrobiia bacterium]MYG94317.1 diaminopimelate decarboxylase [Acidimicrobiia bacterium]MYI30332.1 diaminopimelate decarboxylase [Acidimicrobiia bacterium]